MMYIYGNELNGIGICTVVFDATVGSDWMCNDGVFSDYGY
jgi:hypothetical protein